ERGGRESRVVGDALLRGAEGRIDERSQVARPGNLGDAVHRRWVGDQLRRRGTPAARASGGERSAEGQQFDEGDEDGQDWKAENPGQGRPRGCAAGHGGAPWPEAGGVSFEGSDEVLHAFLSSMGAVAISDRATSSGECR